MLERHDDILFLLADELWLYDRTPISLYPIRLDIGLARDRMKRRSSEMERLLKSEIGALTREEQGRISIVSWNHYSDDAYATLLRLLRSALAALDGFRNSVERIAMLHVEKVNRADTAVGFRLRASMDYIIDEVAMCLRIAEIQGFTAEYYPGAQIDVLRQLYEREFADVGLTVDALVGAIPRREFFQLVAPPKCRAKIA
jgi:hypothetical protein